MCGEQMTTRATSSGPSVEGLSIFVLLAACATASCAPASAQPNDALDVREASLDSSAIHADSTVAIDGADSASDTDGAGSDGFADATSTDRDAGSIGDARVDSSAPDTASDAGPLCEARLLPGVRRLTRATVRLGPNVVDDVDVTRYANLAAAQNAVSPVVPPRIGTWEARFGGFVVGVYADSYVAMEFTTGGAAASGAMTIEADAMFGSGGLHTSISECPGDFRFAQTACKTFANGSLVWRVGAPDPSSRLCQLRPNTRYYFNLRYGTRDNPAVAFCPSGRCGNVFQQLLY